MPLIAVPPRMKMVLFEGDSKNEEGEEYLWGIKYPAMIGKSGSG